RRTRPCPRLKYAAVAAASPKPAHPPPYSESRCTPQTAASALLLPASACRCPASTPASPFQFRCSPRPPGQSPSCGRTSRFRRPRLVRISKVRLAAELQQRIAVLRKWRRLASQLRSHTRVVENRVPHQIRHEHLHQCRAVPKLALAV